MPVVRVLARGARITRVPWVMIVSSALSIGVAVRTGVRELQLIAALVAHRLEQAGLARDPALVKKLAIDLYLEPKRTPDPADGGLRLGRLARKWVFSGALGRNTSQPGEAGTRRRREARRRGGVGAVGDEAVIRRPA